MLFGATGDLATRMLIPSLFRLWETEPAARKTGIIGTGRRPLPTDIFRENVVQILTDADLVTPGSDQLAAFLESVDYLPTDTRAPETFQALAALIREKQSRDAVFYLATPPASYGAICGCLAQAGLNGGQNRIAMEKPIGHDLASSRAINDAVGEYFSEDRLFRIDHYLGKESVQNLMALRFGNGFFEHIWNGETIDNIQITLAETVGVEERFSYYDQYGALRDMVQNHMLQLLCLIAMESPARLDANAVRREKIRLLEKLRPVGEEHIVTGQYGQAENDSALKSYQADLGGTPSRTETYAAIEALIDNDRWRGVPFYLRTGKRLPERMAEIVIQFRQTGHGLFSDQARGAANKLILRLQPNESVKLRVAVQEPGASSPEKVKLRETDLDLSLTDLFSGQAGKSAYERILLSLMVNDATLFVHREEVELAWRWIDTITAMLDRHEKIPHLYPAGSWGPEEADNLLNKNGRKWHD